MLKALKYARNFAQTYKKLSGFLKQQSQTTHDSDMVNEQIVNEFYNDSFSPEDLVVESFEGA